MKTDLTFTRLTESIHKLHNKLAVQASRAVNVSLTLRNWLIGCYIAEYELHGTDRAAYGEALLENLSTTLTDLSVSACGKRQLYSYLRFYQIYPQIVRSMTAQLKKTLPDSISATVEKVSAKASSVSSPAAKVKALPSCGQSA